MNVQHSAAAVSAADADDATNVAACSQYARIGSMFCKKTADQSRQRLDARWLMP